MSVIMEFCASGKHATNDAFRYDGFSWCPEHLPPSGPLDKVPGGTCEIGRVHNAPDGVWHIPSMGDRTACKRHLGILVREIVRRGEFGR